MEEAIVAKRQKAVVNLIRFMASEGYPSSQREQHLLAKYAIGRLTIDEVCNLLTEESDNANAQTKRLYEG